MASFCLSVNDARYSIYLLCEKKVNDQFLRRRCVRTRLGLRLRVPPFTRRAYIINSLMNWYFILYLNTFLKSPLGNTFDRDTDRFDLRT